MFSCCAKHLRKVPVARANELTELEREFTGSGKNRYSQSPKGGFSIEFRGSLLIFSCGIFRFADCGLGFELIPTCIFEQDTAQLMSIAYR